MDQISTTGGTLTLVHFVYTQTVVTGEEWRIACMPNMTEFGETPYHPNYHRTNEVRAVTCPACKRTSYFLNAKETLETALKGLVRAT